MPNVSNYASYDGLGLAELMRNGDVTPKELLEDSYAAIEAVNPQLNGVVSRIPELAQGEIAAGLPDGLFQGGSPLAQGSVDRLRGHVVHQ